MARDFPTHIPVGDVSAIDITGTALTVAFWTNPDTTPSFSFPLAKGTETSNVQYQILRVSNGFRIEIGDATDKDLAEGGSLTPGNWGHVVGRKNGTGAGALSVFLNGASVASATSNRSIQNTGNVLRFGARSDGVSAYDGKIAEIGIWNVALTDAEIASLAKGFSPALVRPQSLQGYWPLDGKSTVERDLRNGNNATAGAAAHIDHPRVIMPRQTIILA